MKITFIGIVLLWVASCSSGRKEITSFKVVCGVDTVQMVISDSTIEGVCNDTLHRDSLIALFDFKGSHVLVDSSEQFSGGSYQDFRKPIDYTVQAEDGTHKHYKVTLRSFAGIPILSINTSGVQIKDKVTYVPGTLTIDGNIDSVVTYKMGIRGRGNTTWDLWLPKLPYKVKFDNKQSVLGFPADKEWALLANFFDKTLIRNDVAFELSERLGRDWTPRRKLVDVFFNQNPIGNYTVTETIKADKNRVNIDVKNGGWLIEINHNAPEDTTRFWIADSSKSLPADIKEGTVNRDSIHKQMDDLFYKLERKEFDSGGYKSIFDLKSYVTWFLVNEIMLNNDAFFYSSVYIQKDSKNSKIKMGPVWDFDLSSGNFHSPAIVSPEGWRLPNAEFAKNIWQDKEFQVLLKETWNGKKNEISSIIDYIKKTSNRIKLSVTYNYKLYELQDWRSGQPNGVFGDDYAGELQYFVDWMEKRISWMDKEINK